MRESTFIILALIAGCGSKQWPSSDLLVTRRNQPQGQERRRQERRDRRRQGDYHRVGQPLRRLHAGHPGPARRRRSLPRRDLVADADAGRQVQRR